jgi:hypothetical protein
VPQTILKRYNFKFLCPTIGQEILNAILESLNENITDEDEKLIKDKLPLITTQEEISLIINKILEEKIESFHEYAQEKLKTNFLARICTPTIIKSKAIQFYSIAHNILSSLENENSIAYTIDLILDTKATQFYYFISEKLPLLKKSTTVIQIIRKLLYYKQFHELLQKTFSIISDRALIELIACIIIRNKIEDWYAYVNDLLMSSKTLKTKLAITSCVITYKEKDFYKAITKLLKSKNKELAEAIVEQIIETKNEDLFSAASQKAWTAGNIKLLEKLQEWHWDPTVAAWLTLWAPKK